MALWNFINEKLKQGKDATIKALQATPDGAIDKIASLELENKTKPLTFADRLIGREITEDTQTTNPETGETKLETITSYRPGLFNDIAGGYRENRYTPASLSNFGQNDLGNGRQKGFGYRLGEGLGSLARIGESPLGRSLLVGGLVGATGGSGLEALAYGAQTGMLNQQNRTNDRIYRDDLIKTQQTALRNSPGFANMNPEEQQAELQKIADNINAQHGYLTTDTYKNLNDAQQLRDNADWKKTYFDAQQNNLEVQREWQRKQAEMQRAEKAADRAFQYYNANLGHQDRMAALEAKGEENNPSLAYADVEQQLNNFKNSFKKVDNPIRYRAFGGASELLNTLTPEEANFNSQRTLLFNQIARKLGGEKGVLSDQDIKRIDAALPKLSDTQKQKEAKMQAVYDLLEIKKGNGLNKDPLGIL